MPRNILLLVADDLGRNLGCYGEQAICTPHLDKMAKEGTLFDMAFTSTASCSPSRSVIYTGLHTHENGQYGLNNTRFHFTTFNHIETGPKLFNEAGYYTGIIGKVHVGPRYVYPWQVYEESASRDVSWLADRTDAFFQNAIRLERPFCLTVAFIDPHRDSTRSGFGNDQTYRDVKDEIYNPNAVTVPPFLSDLPEVRTELAEYYRSINRMDQGIGKILALLEQAGLADDTLVIFVSDNGPPFINSKTTLFDAGVRLPMIVKCPGRKAGTVNPNMVSFIDILPTMLDWAGHNDKKGNRLGRSFLSILDNEQLIDGWDRVFGSHTFHEITNYYPTRFLRTRRYKYHRNIAWKLDFPFARDLYGSLTWQGIRNSKPVMLGARTLENFIRRPPEELYDLEMDPLEIKNLVTDPAYESLLTELRSALEAWQLQTKDAWLFRDGMSVIAMQAHVKAGMKVPDRFDFDVKSPGNRN